MSFNWFISRLKTMSPAEVGFRFGQMVQKNIEKRTQTNKFPTASLSETPPRIFELAEFDFSKETTLKVFDLEIEVNEEINWHLDISSGKEFPKTFSKDIDIRTDRYGSAKYVWEVNRMQFLPRMCMNYKSSQDPDYLKMFIAINNSWINQNPYLIGVNWYANIEINIRLINWFLCWELLNVNELVKENMEFSKFVEEQWIPTIYLHCQYSYDNPSKFSSANNHLISEGAGLFIATSFWKFDKSEKWNVYAQQLLETEIQKQHSPNGVNREEASEYIQFITDFFLLSYVVGKNVNRPFSHDYERMLKNIFYYIMSLMDKNGNVVYYGDEDDGRTFILESNNPFNNFKSLLTSGSIIFQDRLLKTKSNGFDIKNRLMFGSEGKEVYERLDDFNHQHQSKFYKDEGHFILRKTNLDQETFIYFNAAPLGFLSIAAHGHADALSFSMKVDGFPIFIDSGTYTYHSEFDFRQYFMGALSHNTIKVDKKEPANICGPTMWRNHYQSTVISTKTSDQLDQIIASHNGYKSLGLTLQRELTFDKASETVTIVDDIQVEEANQYLYEIPFHLHPNVAVTDIGDNSYLLKVPGARDTIIKLDQQLESNLVTGQLDPILGWYSPSFQKKEPCTVIISQLNKKESFKLTTEITIGNNEN